MTISEMKLNEGKVYKDGNGDTWVVNKGQLVSMVNRYVKICDVYSLKELMGMKFEEIKGWMGLERDTPILVSRDKEKWEYAHFSHYDSGKVFVFPNGKTSWTRGDDVPVNYLFAKLEHSIEDEMQSREMRFN